MRRLSLDQPLGSGAFGTVYAGELHTGAGMRRRVAVKVMQRAPGGDNQQFLTRLRDEARLLSMLQDNAILGVLDLLELEGRDAVVMEWVDGLDVSQLIAAGQRMPPRALAEFGAVVAGALHKAHTAVHPETGEPLQVVHRDVKPANIMLTRRGHIKLLDFGVAKAAFEARESRTGRMVLGTLNYMAPEYIVRGTLDARADIYGLGLSLVEAAVGQPFGQPKLKPEAFQRKLTAWLGALPPEHAPLRPTLERMLAFTPEQRPDGHTAELWLSQLADELTGTGLRRWSAASVQAAQGVQPPALDREGLGGRSFDLDTGGRPPVEPAPPSPPPVTETVDTTHAVPPPPTRQPAPSPAERPPARPPAPSTVSMVLKGLAVGGGLGVVALMLLVAILWWFR
jgi:serine/threonine protein kinase